MYSYFKYHVSCLALNDSEGFIKVLVRKIWSEWYVSLWFVHMQVMNILREINFSRICWQLSPLFHVKAWKTHNRSFPYSWKAEMSSGSPCRSWAMHAFGENSHNKWVARFLQFSGHSWSAPFVKSQSSASKYLILPEIIQNSSSRMCGRNRQDATKRPPTYPGHTKDLLWMAKMITVQGWYNHRSNVGLLGVQKWIQLMYLHMADTGTSLWWGLTFLFPTKLSSMVEMGLQRITYPE